jgi:ribosome modulation factor
MLRIIEIGKNPRKQKFETALENRAYREGYNAKAGGLSTTACDYKPDGPAGIAWFEGYKHAYRNAPTRLKKNPKRVKKIARKVKKIRKRIKGAVRAKIVRVRKNPSSKLIKQRHQTMIVGIKRGAKKHNRLYFTGTGFSQSKDNAKVFAGDAGKVEARRILPMLPSSIYGIQVEKA